MATDSTGAASPVSLMFAFRDEPTLENYLKLRRKYPNQEFDFSTLPGLDWIHKNEALLAKWNLTADLVSGATRGEEQAISELSLRLLERLLEREVAIQQGETQLVGRGDAIATSFVNFLIGVILDGMSLPGALKRGPQDFLFLIKYQLGICVIGDSQAAYESDCKRQDAVFRGAEMIERDGKTSIRAVAKMMGVHVSGGSPQPAPQASRALSLLLAVCGAHAVAGSRL